MCQAVPVSAPHHLHADLHRHARQHRTTQIMRLLRGSIGREWCQLSDLSMAALAIKLERVLSRAFPSEKEACDQVLELRMRHVIKRILDTKVAGERIDDRSPERRTDDRADAKAATTVVVGASI
ncbi:Aste57867_16187 [Aphanomyces stellatus]|uniref:Aste57867_16187 protein n=1 Tax=Aphanomyces stellatus TaxID=120398 RepID=A0A485L5V9_9STRA|nr:hypothetical protein As57867_016131 [Aphanomyces stellatus]VFT92965.1 Aste57867_16187 [Aphanomyces stellatus]